MSYAVVLTKPAIEDLGRLPPNILDHVEQEMRRLADDPIEVSQRAHFPYPQGQMHQSRCVADGNEHLMTILFRYADARSENVITILGIAFQTIGPAADDWSI